MENKGTATEKEIFNLICYMITSARNLVEETKMYGPFRLIDASSRLIEILEKEDLSSSFLDKVRDSIENNKYKVVTDKDGFIRFLDDLVLMMVEELEKGG